MSAGSGSGSESGSGSGSAGAAHQEIEVRSEKVILTNPVIESTAALFAAKVAEGVITAEEGAQLSVWESSLAEARACLAKLLAELETYDANRQSATSAALSWAVLRAKLPEETVLRAGLVFPPEGSAAPPLPHIWALSSQPPRLLPVLARVWGADHPRAGAQLVSDLGGHAVSHLVDVVILGQLLKAGKGAQPLPYTLPNRSARLVPSDRFADLFASLPEQRLVMENLAYVARSTRDYLTWGVPAEVRAFLYPIVMNAVLKDDPTRIEYVRLDEEQVRRVAEAQNGGSAGGEAGAETGVEAGAETGAEAGAETGAETGESGKESASNSFAPSALGVPPCEAP